MCNIADYNTEVFPGELFEIKAVTVGQRMGIIPAVVIAGLSGSLAKGQTVQPVDKHEYRVHSTEKHLTLNEDFLSQNIKGYLKTRLPSHYGTLFNQLVINITYYINAFSTFTL